MLLDGSLAADRYYPHIAAKYPSLARGFRLKDGHAYSAYPVATPLLVTPLYIPAAIASRALGWDAARVVTAAAVMEKLSASLVAALSVALFYGLARRLAGPRRALLAALVYGFATQTWAISSQALWQHGASELAVIAALYFLARWTEGGGSASLALAGLSAGIALAVRPTNVLLVAALACGFLAARGGWRRLLVLLSLPVLFASAQAAYNLWVFGRSAGGYDAEFSGAFWRGLAGLVASPGRGLLVYTPIAVFSLCGMWIVLRNANLRRRPVYLASVLFAIASVLLLSKWRIWWGGHCWGPRLLTDIAPCLVLLMLPAMDQIRGRAWLGALFGVTLALSVFVQGVGAFCYPQSRWDEIPAAVGDRPARLWDWGDNPIGRSLAAGPRIGPAPGAWPLLRRLIIRDSTLKHN